MSRLDEERQLKYEQQRIDQAAKKIFQSGCEILEQTNRSVTFLYKDQVCRIWPYSGWHTGKSITDGRGLRNLLKQLK